MTDDEMTEYHVTMPLVAPKILNFLGAVSLLEKNNRFS